MERKSRNIEVYNRTAEQMAKKFNALGARVKDIEQFFALLPQDNPFVVEIGCGNGRDAKEIVARTKNYLGLDISAGMIDAARSHVPGGHFEVVDVENYEFPKDIDGVVSFASLLHSNKESLRRVLHNVHASLKSGGVFFISLKKGEYDENGSDKTDEFGTRTYFFYTPTEIEVLTGEAYETVTTEEQHLNGQDWFTIILRKR